MTGKLKVPEMLETTFNRLLQRVPRDSRNDGRLQKSVLLFLKLGGERLARARIKPVVLPFPDDIAVIKPRPQLIPNKSDEANDVLDDPESTETDDLSEEEDESD